MRVLGIDPGFERLGIAVLEKNTGDRKEGVVFSECFKTSKNLDFSERLKLIGDRIKEIIKNYQPEIIAIETLFFTNNQKTVMRVAETRGVVIYEGSLSNLEIIEISPLQIKMAITGYGRADKKQIMKMLKMLIEIDAKKTSDDELDAIAIALSAFANYRK